MTDSERARLRTDPDYIVLKRFANSLRRLEERYPDGGCPDHLVAEALGMTEGEERAAYLDIVKKLRTLIGA